MEDPVVHCLDGESLLLTGFAGTGKTHLAKRIVEALREHGVVTKTHAAVQNVGLGAQTADHWVRRNGHCSATWLVIEELTQLDTPLWADIACLSMNKKIRFLLLGDFRQLPAVLDPMRSGCRSTSGRTDGSRPPMPWWCSTRLAVRCRRMRRRPCPHFTLKHLYMGCSRATNSELLSVL